MLFPVEQAFVGRDEKRAPLKTPAWGAIWASAPGLGNRCIKFYSKCTYLPFTSSVAVYSPLNICMYAN